MFERITSSSTTNSTLNLIFENGYLGCTSWASWDKISLSEHGGFLLYSSPVKSILFNGVVQRSPDLTVTQDVVTWALDRFTDQYRGNPFVWITPAYTSTINSGASEVLLSQGFSKLSSTSCMARSLENLPGSSESGISEMGSISEIQTARDLKWWSELLLKTYGFSPPETKQWYQLNQSIGFGKNKPWQHFAISTKKKCIATGSIFLGPNAASIANLAVHPQIQGHGIGTRLIHHLLRTAEKNGYTLVTLFASPEALPLYLRCGFDSHGTVDNFLMPS